MKNEEQEGIDFTKPALFMAMSVLVWGIILTALGVVVYDLFF